jgi:hypothetical protein
MSKAQAEVENQDRDGTHTKGITMLKTSDHLEKSLSGDWVGLARDWLEQNGPCAYEKYFASVRPLMPTHILLDGKRRASQEHLTKAAAKKVAIVDEHGSIRVRLIEERGETGRTMAKQRFEIHPAANLFPLMTEEEYEGLKQDIAENGQREDIVVWCGKLIDGRNRLRACEELQRQPSIAELDEDQDPWKYVISHNLHRRHLTTTQRSAVAGKLATLKRGGDRKSDEFKVSKDTSIADAAKLMNVSEVSVKRAKQVIEHGSKELVAAMERGDVSVSTGANLVASKVSKAEQARLVEQGDEAIRKKIAENVEKMRKDLIAQDRKEGSKHSHEVRLASSAMEFTTMAISQLQRIRPDDEKRGEAYQKVVSWIEKQGGAFVSENSQVYIPKDPAKAVEKYRDVFGLEFLFAMADVIETMREKV